MGHAIYSIAYLLYIFYNFVELIPPIIKHYIIPSEWNEVYGMVEFGEKLRRLRKQKQLTQRQLADLIGVQHTIISFYELGDRVPSPEVIVKLASVLHVSSDYLLGLEKKETVDISGLAPNDCDLVRALVDSLREKNID